MPITSQAAISRRRRWASGPSRLVLSHTFTGADSAVAVPNADTGQAPTVVRHGGIPDAIYGIQGNKAYLANVNGATDYTFCHFDGGAAGDFRVEWDFPAFLIGDNLQSTGGCFATVNVLNCVIWDMNNLGGNNAAAVNIYKDTGAGFAQIGATSSAFDMTVAGTLSIVGIVATGTIIVRWNNTVVFTSSALGGILSGTRFGLSHIFNLRAIRYDALRVYR